MSRYWRGERARCTITTPQGERVMLSVPLCKHTEGEISYMHKWQHQHWMALVSAYGKTPYFEYYKPYIEPIYKTQYKTIDELNEAIEYVVGCFLSNTMPEDLGNKEQGTRNKDCIDTEWRTTEERTTEWPKDEMFPDRLFEYGPEITIKRLIEISKHRSIETSKITNNNKIKQNEYGKTNSQRRETEGTERRDGTHR